MNQVLGARGATGYVLGRGASGAASNGLLTGLVAYWKLDEASGNAIDAHSNGLTLTAANAPGNAAGQVYATARTFNGSSQYFSRASEAALQTGNIDFSVAVWVYQDALATKILFGQWRETDNQRSWRLFVLSTGSAVFAVSADGTAAASTTATSTWSAAAWHLLLAWHDATANKIYISIDNGTPAEAAWSTGAAISSALLTIGRQDSGSAYFNGRIGPVAMWKNRTLNAADRTLLWNGGAGLAYSAFS